MKEEKSNPSGATVLGGLVFVAGLAISLILGWAVFPNLLYSQKTQPINFSHAAHSDNECDACHAFRPDGTYTGIPKLEKCKECHESVQGNTDSERILVEKFIQNDREVPWLVYAWQPDNVYFSHAAHKAGEIECIRCHRDVQKEHALPVLQQNRFTGYSKNTMEMRECEDCHAERGITNNCEMCHK